MGRTSLHTLPRHASNALNRSRMEPFDNPLGKPRRSVRGEPHSDFGPMYRVATTTSSYQTVRVVPPPIRA